MGIAGIFISIVLAMGATIATLPILGKFYESVKKYFNNEKDDTK